MLKLHIISWNIVWKYYIENGAQLLHLIHFKHNVSSQPIISSSQGILGNALIVLHSHLSQTWWICNQLPYFLITVTSVSLAVPASFFFICFQMFPAHQPQPSAPRSACHIVPLLTSTAEKPPLLMTSRRLLPKGRANCSSPSDCSLASSATQVSLSLSSIHSPVSGSSAGDVSVLARTNEVVRALNQCPDPALVWSSEGINTFLCILSEISTFRRSVSGVRASNIRYNTKYCIFSITEMPAVTTNLQTQKMELKRCKKLLLVAGPSWKRRICTSSDSETEKTDQKRSKRRGQRSPVMKPRQLFKACETQHYCYSRHHLWISPFGHFSKRTWRKT